ncbi:MAG: lactonase family protein [Pirellulaceae bacterium]
MESYPTQAVLPLVGLAAEKGIRDRYNIRSRFVFFLSLLLWFTIVAAGIADELDVWIGTTTPRRGLSKGIYHGVLDVDNGTLTRPRLAAEMSSPGFLALHPSGKALYATGSLDGVPSVAAFRIQERNGRSRLSMINSQPIGDGGAAHLATDRTGKVLLTAQYGGGSTAIYPLADDLSISEQSELIKHEGASGVVSNRQSKPHAHWVGTSPDNRFVFVPDLGMDKVVIYRLDVEQAGLTPHGSGQCPPGGGPRHMKFHTSGEFIYVLNELELSVTVFEYDSQAGRMTALQTIPTVSEADKAKEEFVSASEIRVHPSGQFVYAANRGHDTITAFRTQSGGGKLALVECEPMRGSWPRNFNIDPTGKWLLAAGRDSNNIAVFSIDSETGELTYTRNMAMVPTPICVAIETPTK